MEEQKTIRKTLLKNTIMNFIIFLIMFLIFALAIYKQVSNSLYTSIDEELNSAKDQYIQFGTFNLGGSISTDIKGSENKRENNEYIEERQEEEQKDEEGAEKDVIEKIKGFKETSPRVITIVRDLEGNIISSQSVGNVYEYYEEDIPFDSLILNQIYSLEINNEYYYRAINFIVTDENEEEKYIQLLANVDGEIQTLKNLTTVLIVGTIILTAIAIIISYILAKRVVRPFIESYNKQTEFVQNASHELRTPLTIIQTQQELLLQEPDSKIIDQSENINQTLKETKRMTKLIKELMQLARFDNNEKQKLNMTEFDINELIKEIVIPFKEYANLQEKEIILNLGNVKPIKAEKSKIEELLIILLDNSIKYTNSKDTITITTEKKEGKLNIEVADTGIGINEEAMPHIFERFYRGDVSHSKKIEGSGLGLSIAKNIVEMHKGSIKVLKNTPKGTKFVVKL